MFAEKMWEAFANVKATHIFFSKNISIYTIFNDQSFNYMLTKMTPLVLNKWALLIKYGLKFVK